MQSRREYLETFT